ncbi:MAG: hypothetical protein EDM82_07605 [Cyanobacteria bacterium CYA]|nr:MAG: hypothetical protein EDM82_07605 [Cyanobacteria bacterium CYA]
MVPQAHRVWFGVSDRTDPRIINFSDAPSRIVRLVLERTGRAGGVVGIGGPAGAGKSTLADLLGGLVVRTDDYLPNYDEVPEQERDEPRHADLGALVAHLVDLRAGVEVDAPVWCFKTHRRIGVRRLSPGPMVVCEGIHALHARRLTWRCSWTRPRRSAGPAGRPWNPEESAGGASSGHEPISTRWPSRLSPDRTRSIEPAPT